MKNFELDTQLRNTLHDCVDGMQADDTLKARIDFMVNNSNTAGKKKTMWRKLAIGLAAAVCLTSIGAFARGQVAGLVSSLYVADTKLSVEELQKDAAKVADGISIPENLGGYAFQRGAVEYTDKLDADGNRFGTYPEVDAAYGSGINGEDVVFSYYARVYDEELDGEGLLPKDYEGQPYEERDVNGVTVFYRADEYLFVPVGYELTADEQARMDANELYVSEGSDEREEAHYQSVSWQIGDVVYSLMTHDADVSMEDLFAAAAEAMADAQ